MQVYCNSQAPLVHIGAVFIRHSLEPVDRHQLENVLHACTNLYKWLIHYRACSLASVCGIEENITALVYSRVVLVTQ